MDTQNTSSEPKLCINCKHIGTNSSGDWTKYRCFAPQNYAGVNLVTGDKEYCVSLCAANRATGIEGVGRSCTAIGQWYEPKPPAPAIVPYGGADEVTPAQLAAKVMAAKNKRISSSAGTDLLRDLGL